MRSKKVIEFSKDFVDNRPTTRHAPPAQAQAEPRLYGDAVASLLDFLIRRPAFDAALKDAPVPPSREAAPTTLKPPAPALPAPAAPPMAGMPAPPPLPTYSATEQVNMRPEFGQTMLAPREKTGFGSRLKQGLLSALAGASANAESGDLGRMLGGALAGGAGGAIRPQAGADLQHQVWVEPRRQAAIQQAQQQQVLDLKGQQAGLEAEKTRAEIERLRRPERERPVIVGAGQTAIGPDGKPIYTAPERPARPATGFTLGEGQTRYDAQGNPIAAGPPKAPREPKDNSAALLARKAQFEALKARRDQFLADAEQFAATQEWDKANAARNKAAALNTQAEAMAVDMATLNPEEVEGGPGAGGSPYVKLKPKGKGQAPAQPAGGQKVFPASEVAEFARRKGMTPEQAQQYISSKGYTIRGQ